MKNTKPAYSFKLFKCNESSKIELPIVFSDRCIGTIHQKKKFYIFENIFPSFEKSEGTLSTTPPRSAVLVGIDEQNGRYSLIKFSVHKSRGNGHLTIKRCVLIEFEKIWMDMNLLQLWVHLER